MNQKHEELQRDYDALRGGEETPELVDAITALAGYESVDGPRRGLELAQEALAIAERIGYERGVVDATASIGFAYYILSDHEGALPYLISAMKAYERQGETSFHTRTLSVLAAVYQSMGDYEPALAYAMKALDVQNRLGDKRSAGWTLHGIGNAYTDMGDYDRALEYVRRSFRFFDDVDDEVGRARALNGIGTVHQRRGEYDIARENHLKSLELFRKSDNRLGEARAMNDLGLIHQAMKEFDEAEKCHRRALELREEVGNKQAQSTSLIALGQLFTDKGDAQGALGFLHRALTLAMEIKAKPRIYQANLALSDAYELAGQYGDALAHYKIYQQVREEVTGDQANTRLRNMQVGFEVEQSQKEAEISRLKNVELREKNDQLEKLLTELSETQSQLVQSEKMAALGTLVAGIVHELNNPLGAINSATDISRRCLKKVTDLLVDADSLDELRDNPEMQRCLRILEDNQSVSIEGGQRISKIVQSLKSFVRLDQATFQRADIHEGLDSAVTLFEVDVKDRVKIVKEYGDLPLVPSNPGELNQVFMHLLTNAAQAIEGRGTITIRTYPGESDVRVEVSDTGVGIPEDVLEHLFEPTITKKGARVKAGLGLFTSYNIVQKHNGDIRVTSKPGEGTTFTMTLPTTVKTEAT